LPMWASPLGDGFAWLGTPSALIMLSVAALVEVLAYTIPVIDNLLDVVSAPAAFIAGTILSAAVMTGMPPMVKWTAAVIAGGGVAGLMRGSIGVLRAHSTVLTGGLGELRHLHCGTWRRGAHILFGACRADRGDRAGRAVPVRRCDCSAGCFEAPNHRTVGHRRFPALALLCPRATPEIRTWPIAQPLIIDNLVRPLTRVLGVIVANPLARRDLFLLAAGCSEQILGFSANPSYTFAYRKPRVLPSVRRT
jgi:hypothetical protein